MNELGNAPERNRISGAGVSEQISFGDAARFLGVDTFTFYTLVQRGEITPILDEWGEFVVSQSDLEDLVAAKE